MKQFPLIIAIALAVPAQQRNQATAVATTADGLHTITFTTPAGVIRAQFPDDAAAGDTLSGVVLEQPAPGAQSAQKNSGELTGMVVEVNRTQRKPVNGEPRALWTIPSSVEGQLIVRLLNPKGTPVAESAIPIAPRPSLPPAREFQLPELGQGGVPSTVSGAFDGDSRNTSVKVGDSEARILAESPRKVVFATPLEPLGSSTIEVRQGERKASGPFRIVSLQLTATQLSLVKGQTATLAVVLKGLDHLTYPVDLTITNNSPSVISVEGGATQKVTILPDTVRSDGTYGQERTITGIRAGGYDIRARVQKAGGAAAAPRAPVAERAVGAALDAWQQRNGIAVTAEARQLIQGGVNEAGQVVDRLQAVQQRYEKASADLLTELVRHYCFDLRDAKVARPFAAVRAPMVFGFQSAGAGMPATLEARDVSIRPFTHFAEQFDDGKPKGYLDLSSNPNLADIAIDNNRIGFTNRSAVVTAGEHSVRTTLNAARLNCRKDVKVKAGERASIACPD
jgi:hypothetical protein